jgi:hypothetical protein
MPARRIGGHSQWLPGRAASGCTVAADALWRAGWPSPRLPAPTARGCFHAHNQLRQLPDCPARGDGSLPLSGTTCQVRSSKSRLAHALGGSGDSILSIDARVVHAAMHHLTYSRNRAGERRCEGWVVGRRQVTCSAVSGKSLARGPLRGRLWHERRRHRPGSPGHMRLASPVHRCPRTKGVLDRLARATTCSRTNA